MKEIIHFLLNLGAALGIYEISKWLDYDRQTAYLAGIVVFFAFQIIDVIKETNDDDTRYYP